MSRSSTSRRLQRAVPIALLTCALAASAPALPAQESRHLRLDVLVVVYPETFAGSIDAAGIEHVRQETREAVRFLWRISRLRLLPAVEPLTVPRLLPREDFNFYEPSNYWLGPQTVEGDLRNLGYEDDSFDAVVAFYAFVPEDDHYNKWAGATRGVNTLLGKAAYVGIPLSGDSNRYNRVFEHEFLHVLASVFRSSGYPEFPLVHDVHLQTGVYDDDDTWYEWLLARIPDANYFEPTGVWGTVESAPDQDSDRFPDTSPIGAVLPLTEQDFHSAGNRTDTDADGLEDLAEALAGIREMGDPRSPDTDLDGQRDGDDPAPLDPAELVIRYSRPVLDGSLEGDSYSYGDAFGDDDPADLSATVRTAWNEDALLVALEIRDDLIDVPWQNPGGNDAVFIQIDAASDGFLHQGEENYEIIISPAGPADAPLLATRAWRPDKSLEEDVPPAETVLGAWSRAGDTWVLEVAIPPTGMPGFETRPGATFRMQVYFQDRDGKRFVDEKNHYFAFARHLSFVLEGEDCNSNRIPDAVDITQGTSNDRNLDGIPDDCQPCCDLGLGDMPDPVLLDGGTRALAFTGSLTASNPDEGLSWDAITFENVGAGQAASLVQAARLYIDEDSDGKLDASDPPIGEPEVFLSRRGPITFEDLGVDVPAGSSVSYLLVLDLAPGSGEAALGAPPRLPAGLPPGAGFLLLEGLLLALLCLQSRRLRLLTPVVFITLWGVALLLAPGCGGGGGGSSAASVSTELQMKLLDVEAHGTTSAEPVVTTGLPLTAWPFEAP